MWTYLTILGANHETTNNVEVDERERLWFCYIFRQGLNQLWIEESGVRVYIEYKKEEKKDFTHRATDRMSDTAIRQYISNPSIWFCSDTQWEKKHRNRSYFTEISIAEASVNSFSVKIIKKGRKFNRISKSYLAVTNWVKFVNFTDFFHQSGYWTLSGWDIVKTFALKSVIFSKHVHCTLA